MTKHGVEKTCEKILLHSLGRKLETKRRDAKQKDKLASKGSC